MADEVKYSHRKTIPMGTIQLYEGDAKLLEYIQEYLGCSKAEAVRSAIRSMGTQLSVIDKRHS